MSDDFFKMCQLFFRELLSKIQAPVLLFECFFLSKWYVFFIKLDYLIIFVISHNYFIISCHIWSFFFFVNYLSSSSCIFFVFPYIMYSYILDILFLIVLSFSFGGHFLYGNSVSPYCFHLPTVLLHIVFFL